mgnify:CR=1 FL=1
MSKKKTPLQKHDEEEWKEHSLDATPTDVPEHYSYYGARIQEVPKEDGRGARNCTEKVPDREISGLFGICGARRFDFEPCPNPECPSNLKDETEKIDDTEEQVKK